MHTGTKMVWAWTKGLPFDDSSQAVDSLNESLLTDKWSKI